WNDDTILETCPELYMQMIDTAENVAIRYGIGRDRQDEYSLQSQQRTAAAKVAGRFDAEIVPMDTSMLVVDRETRETCRRSVTIAEDEGNRADTTLEGLASLKPVRGGNSTITAGNASQLSDGASACVIMD